MNIFSMFITFGTTEKCIAVLKFLCNDYNKCEFGCFHSGTILDFIAREMGSILDTLHDFKGFLLLSQKRLRIDYLKEMSRRSMVHVQILIRSASHELSRSTELVNSRKSSFFRTKSKPRAVSLELILKSEPGRIRRILATKEKTRR